MPGRGVVKSLVLLRYEKTRHNLRHRGADIPPPPIAIIIFRPVDLILPHLVMIFLLLHMFLILLLRPGPFRGSTFPTFAPDTLPLPPITAAASSGRNGGEPSRIRVPIGDGQRYRFRFGCRILRRLGLYPRSLGFRFSTRTAKTSGRRKGSRGHRLELLLQFTAIRRNLR